MSAGVLCAGLLAALPASGAEQAEDSRRNVASVEPLFLALDLLTLDYERALLPELSLFAQPSVTHYAGRDGFLPGVALALGVRGYPLGTAPAGFYVEGSLGGGAQWEHSSVPDEPRVLITTMLGASAGYTFVVGGWWTLTVGLGAVYRTFDGFGPEGEDSFAPPSFAPRIRLATGVQF